MEPQFLMVQTRSPKKLALLRFYPPRKVGSYILLVYPLMDDVDIAHPIENAFPSPPGTPVPLDIIYYLLTNICISLVPIHEFSQEEASPAEAIKQWRDDGQYFSPARLLTISCWSNISLQTADCKHRP